MWQWILRCDTKTQAMATKIDKLHFIKIKLLCINVCYYENEKTMDRMKENACKSYIS